MTELPYRTKLNRPGSGTCFKKENKKEQSENMAFSLEVAFSVKKNVKWVGEWLHAHLQDCICTLTMSACLNACQSVCLLAHVHGSAWGPANEWKMKNEKKKVLSISAAWAGSWWEQEGRHLAGRSHALFRHHSDGAQPLGQNTAWFSGTLTRVSWEKPRTSIRTSPSYSNCSPSTTVGAIFCPVHSK